MLPLVIELPSSRLSRMGPGAGRLVPEEIPKPRRREFRVSNRVLDILMTEVLLN